MGVTIAAGRRWLAATVNGDVAMVKTLLAAGADVNQKKNWGETALMLSVEHPEVFRVLLAAKPEANAETTRSGGGTALVYALERGTQ